MTTSAATSIAALTVSEREYIRRELDQFFGRLPTVAEGFQLRIWRGSPQKGQPKLPPPVFDRGLMGAGGAEPDDQGAAQGRGGVVTAAPQRSQ